MSSMIAAFSITPLGTGESVGELVALGAARPRPAGSRPGGPWLPRRHPPRTADAGHSRRFVPR